MALFKSIEDAIKDFPLDSQHGNIKDALCCAVLCIGSISWYIIEGERVGDDILMFGVVIGWVDDEFSYVSLNELFKLGQIRLFTPLYPIPFKEIKDPHLQQFLNTLTINE